MKIYSRFLALACLTSLVGVSWADTPYRVLNVNRVEGNGRIDYVYADSPGRRVYVPRGDEVEVYDLDTLQLLGKVADTGGHGVALDPSSHHAFSSSKQVSMFDTTSLKLIKKIDVQGNPDGIFFEPKTRRIYVLSHHSPSLTALDAKDGSIVGTAELDAAPEQCAADGDGHVFVDLEDKDAVAVIHAGTLKVVTRYGLGGQGGTPAGLALDAKQHRLFVMCRKPAVCVVLDSRDGHVLTTLPIGNGCDGAGFDPATGEVFASCRDGTLTVIKDLKVEQTLATRAGAKTCSLDLQKHRVALISLEPQPGAPESRAGTLDLILVGH